MYLLSYFKKFNVRADGNGNPSSTYKHIQDYENRKTVVIGGGTGFIGTALTGLLKVKGYEVVLVSRTRCEDYLIRQRRMTWEDLEVQGLPPATVAVVNLTGENILNPLSRWTESFKNKVYNSRVDSAAAFKKSIEKSPHKPQAFVQVTGVAYYDPDSDKVHDESSTEGGKHDFLAKMVGDTEKTATLDQTPETRNVMLRSGVVLGRTGGLIQKIIRPFFWGLGGIMGSGAQPMPWIHVKDLSGLIIHSIENKSVEGVVNGVAPDMINNEEFVYALCKQIWRPRLIPTPDFVWNFIFGPERASMILKGPKVTPKKALDTGYKFRFPTIASACEEFHLINYVDRDYHRLNFIYS